MQVGKSKPQILATCRLGNQNPKFLLHAGWEIKTPNPCYMQAGKFKPQILPTCRLGNQNPKSLLHAGWGNSNPKSLLHAGWEIKAPNPCYMQAGKFKTQILTTCRLENQKPQSLLHAGWEIKTPNPCYMQVGKFKFKHLILATCRLRVQNPHILATRRLGNQTPSVKALLHAGREVNPQIIVSGMMGNQTPNPCYMQVGRAKSSNHCCTQVGNSDAPPPRPLQILLHGSFENPNTLFLATCRFGNQNTQILAARRLRKHPKPPSNFLLHAT